MADSNALSLFIGANAAGMVGETYGTASAAGTAITDATQLTNKVSVVSGANGNAGVIIPTVGVLQDVIVKNADNAILKVYPANSSDKLNGGSTGASVSIAAYAAVWVKRISATDNIAIEIPAA